MTPVAEEPGPPQRNGRRRQLGFAWAFVLLAAAVGGSYALLMPPLQVADEAAHLFRSYGVSRGICLAPEFTPLPFSVRRLHHTFPPSLEKRRLVTWREIWAWRSVELNTDNTKYVRAIATNVYSCVPYLPSALALRAATALDLSPLWLIYAGRFANLATYIVLVAIALAILPDFRGIVLALALMPMSLHQAASFSADSLTIATSLLATSVVLNLSMRAGATIATSDVLGLSLVMSLTALCKSNVALVGLVGLLPHRAFRSWPRHLSALALVLAAGVGAAALWAWFNRDNTLLFAARRMNDGIDAAANARAVLEHPLAFLVAVTRSVSSDGASYLAQLVGLLGYGSIPLPRWTIWLYGAILLASPFLGTRVISLTWAGRILAGTVALGGCLLTFISLFLISGRTADVSSLSQIRIEGLAGRYFIPFAFPALLALAVPYGKSWADRFGIAVWLAAAVVNVVALTAIAGHYYTTERIAIDTAVFDLKAATVVPIRAGTRLEQTLTPRFNKLSRIDLDVAVYGRPISRGQLLVNVHANTGETLMRQRLPLRDMGDGSHVSVRFDRPVDSKGVPLRVELALDAAPPDAVLGFYTTGGKQDLYEQGTLAVDGHLLPNRDLILRAYRHGRNDSVVPSLRPPPPDPSREENRDRDEETGAP